MRKIKYSILVLISILYFSCQKKESNTSIPVEKETTTNVEEVSVQVPEKEVTVKEIIPIVKNELPTKSVSVKKEHSDSENKVTQIATKETEKTLIVVSEEKAVSVKETELQKFYKKNSKKAQQFVVNSSKANIIVCAEKTKITIHENSFVSSITGKEITGKVQISVKEYYKMSNILLAKLSTTSNGDLLESGGMINITAMANNEECKLKEGKAIEIEFPTKKAKDGMQLFNGVKNDNGTINWVIEDEKYFANDEIQNEYDLSNSVDELPVFRGGEKAIWAFFHRNYEPQDENTKGKIYVDFMVDKEGNVRNVIIKKGLSAAIDKEVVRVVQKFPKFIPGKLNGVAVNTYQTLHFYINTTNAEQREIEIQEAKEKFEQVYKDDAVIKTANVEDIKYYLLLSSKMGMINCDRFNNQDNKINYAVNFKNDSETSVNIIFHRMKSFMNRYTNSNSARFENIPLGEKITIIAIKYIQDRPYLAVKDTEITDKIENGLVFQPVTLESLKSEMKKLDRFN